MYNVTMKLIRVTIVLVDKQQILHILRVCVCSFIYPTRKAHAPYYIVISGLSGSTTFSRISHKPHDFRTKDFEHKLRVLVFSTVYLKRL